MKVKPTTAARNATLDTLDFDFDTAAACSLENGADCTACEG